MQQQLRIRKVRTLKRGAVLKAGMSMHARYDCGEDRIPAPKSKPTLHSGGTWRRCMTSMTPITPPLSPYPSLSGPPLQPRRCTPDPTSVTRSRPHSQAMLTASCHCAAVRIEVDSKPTYVNQCHCSICRRYGTLWAYYQKPQVKLSHEADGTEIYLWGDKMIEFHRCRKCGCVTHWAPVDRSESRMAINARLLDEADLKDVPILPNFDDEDFYTVDDIRNVAIK